ncbi:hypothetical protein EMIHUDRAFT_233581 [Emiliania huxleyi CCMP1516]|uniref:Uncharacterized protein n=2 Tax=Emiliania huxleyi TaxID=2903 RepID=A0A0D3K1Q9_EMIH1|nr:hypothetical protein EMIHUDRAFT_233581 [Emiliania huxleyi CCMP1516]EOD29694.1 hypothetical protein EMIHUDRAFT_233581 [Emiliania huxleyi CCMP1516]|eukprot:XP_005782123.1 hypothetical protein EMIHUDRAFT_233581 [Emiliania huxleyi CCMP1516]
MAVDAGSTGGAACLATIMTEDRVLAFHRLAASWPWPISVAYLSTEWHRDRRLGLQLLDVQAQPPPEAHRIVLSVVADRGYRQPQNLFPFNLLRNVAVENCASKTVLVADVDFVLGGSVGGLTSAVAEVEEDPRVAVLLPAFDVRAGQAPAPTAESVRLTTENSRGERGGGNGRSASG